MQSHLKSAVFAISSSHKHKIPQFLPPPNHTHTVSGLGALMTTAHILVYISVVNTSAYF